MSLIILESRRFERNGLLYTVKRVLDETPDLSYLDPDATPEYAEENQARLDAYNRGDWCMVGVCVDIQIQTRKNWVDPPVVGRASLWGIESDSDDTDFAEVESDLIREAEEDVDCLREVLCVQTDTAVREVKD